MDWLSLLLVFATGLFGGSYGTLVGGTSLITIPVLILLGLPPHAAIGTDRLGITGLSSVGWYKFHKKGFIDYRIALMMGSSALVGSFLGAHLVLKIPVPLLKKIIALVTFLMLILIIIQPKIGIEKRKSLLRKKDYGLGLFLSFIVGIYGGFYGAMAGTFLLYLSLFIFKQTFLEGTGTLKLPSFMMTTIAAIIFARKGAIHYPFAGAMFLGCAIGSYFGAHYSDRIGNLWIKRLFILIVLIMSLRLWIQ